MGAQDNRITSLTLGTKHVDAQSSPVTYGHPDITLDPDTRGRRRNRDRRRKNPPQTSNRIPPARPFTRHDTPPATAHQRHNASQKQSHRQQPPFPSHVPILPTFIPQPSSNNSNNNSVMHFPTDPPSRTSPPLQLPVDSRLLKGTTDRQALAYVHGRKPRPSGQLSNPGTQLPSAAVLVCGRVRPQPYWLKASPLGRCVLTSEGLKPECADKRRPEGP
jgi:hypothetical protein